MVGFQDVEQPAEAVGHDAVQQPIMDLAGLLDSENEPHEEPVVEEVSEAEPEQLSGEESGQEQEQPEVEDSEPVEPDLFTVKVSGEERQVTLNDLKEGFQLKSDYTRKTQDLAEREQQLQQQAQGVIEQEKEYGQLVDALKQRLDTLIPPEPDWAQLAQTDPIEHTRQRAAWDQLQKQVKTVEAEQERLAEESQKRMQQDYHGYLRDQQQRLVTALPDLKEPEKARDFFTNLNQYAINEYGFNQQEVMSIADHRFYLIAEKARKYDQLQADTEGKVVGQKHVPTLKPGAKTRSEPVRSKSRRKAKERLERTGHTRDAAAAFESLL